MNENGGDSSDGSTDSQNVCRDFIRNVCHRGKNCRFIHPENIKVRNDPIFCHDFQQGRCFRGTCKFVHCTREEEEHFKQTGELIVDSVPVTTWATTPTATNGNSKRHQNGRHSSTDEDESIPVCKDFLNGACDRPPGGCKYRHPHRSTQSSRPQQQQQSYGGGRGNGGNGVQISRGGHVAVGPPPPPPITARRKMHEMGYDDGGPEAKLRYQPQEYLQQQDYQEVRHHNQERLINHNHTPCYYTAPPPPGIPFNSGALTIGPNGLQNGHHPGYQAESHSHHPANNYAPCDAMKALEDENFMLKRRIEELKTSNEFLLAQNAQLSQLRLNNSMTTSVAQVQPLAVSAVTVSAAGPTAQSSIIGITSSSLSGTQPLPTISISTLPTVTPVSISQTLQPQQSQPQTIYAIPAQQN